jgi:cobyrinic acid a,c-diamide synthase
MARVPRLAVGIAERNVDSRPLLWALGAVLQQRFGAVQPFLATAHHDGLAGVCLGASRAARQLDSWVMTRGQCRCSFSEAMEDARLGLVIGEAARPPGGVGGDWHTLGDWLDCPKIAVVDVTQIDGCNFPKRPGAIDAILIDGPRDLAEACHWQVRLETLWHAPVLGWLGELPPLRAIATHLKSGVKPATELCRVLGANLEAQLNWPLLDSLLARKPFFPRPEQSRSETPPYLGACRIALALDDAFHAYHADSLEWLTSAGAEILDFSPLKDGSLPDEVDLVYLGAGDLTAWLPRLSANHCMHHALRTFAARGGRIYAEGPAVSYLGRTAQVAGEQPLPMSGLLPLKSLRATAAARPVPTEVLTSHECWLAPAGTRLRGYQSGVWHSQPAGPMLTYCTHHDQRCTLVGRNQVVANLAPLHLAAHAALLPRFFKAAQAAPIGAIR